MRSIAACLARVPGARPPLIIALSPNVTATIAVGTIAAAISSFAEGFSNHRLTGNQRARSVSGVNRRDAELAAPIRRAFLPGCKNQSREVPAASAKKRLSASDRAADSYNPTNRQPCARQSFRADDFGVYHTVISWNFDLLRRADGLRFSVLTRTTPFVIGSPASSKRFAFDGNLRWNSQQ
jgi:hypothetical protein